MIVSATLVLLFVMTGSVIVPIKAVIMNVLSLGASFGALVWVFQDGNLSGLLAFDSVGAIDLWMPILVLIFAFGLSMDYEVFLLSRIKECHDRTGDNDLSVALGMQHTGRIITSAALLIVVVFAGFAAGEVLAIKQPVSASPSPSSWTPRWCACCSSPPPCVCSANATGGRLLHSGGFTTGSDSTKRLPRRSRQALRRPSDD